MLAGGCYFGPLVLSNTLPGPGLTITIFLSSSRVSYFKFRRVEMITAIVMINADRNSIPETAQQIADIGGVSEVYSVSGEFDIVAVLKVKQYEDLAELVTEHLLKMPAITHTRTLMAFRTFSKSDLEHVFDIGSEE
jgi:DNA-binding Lrp family transcriptional regulator